MRTPILGAVLLLHTLVAKAAPEIQFQIPDSADGILNPFIKSIQSLISISVLIIGLTGAVFILLGLVNFIRSGNHPAENHSGKSFRYIFMGALSLAFVDFLSILEGTVWGENSTSILSYDYPNPSPSNSTLSLTIFAIGMVLKLLGVSASYRGVLLMKTAGADDSRVHGAQIFWFFVGGAMCMSIYKTIELLLSFFNVGIQW